MHGIREYIWLIPCLPLIGALCNGITAFLGIRLPKLLVAGIAVGVMAGAFVVSCFSFLEIYHIHEGSREFIQVIYEWIHIGKLSVPLGFLVDPLSCVMILIITGVGTLIHIYSYGYMHEDPGFQRYFTYLNLFVFFMLLLVLGENILIMFVGWEGVGLCSYLLIGFWFQDKEKAVAGMKAFIVNRIGDFAFICGFCLLYWGLAQHGVHTLSFMELREHAPLLTGMTVMGMGIVTAITLLFFIGATGKSAQIPLYVWLPDAMAGPTPVSALIHAATMVTAGVYMIGRNYFFFEMAPVTMTVVATVGALTALFAATIGCTQYDIKKVLAYSTVSQLGYMFLGMGVGAFSAGIMHLMTHAFFKGLLFLGAGSVIHAMHHEQDMRKMGGLRHHIPWTYLTFLAGFVAIIGLPPFAGFVSKDEILWLTYSSGVYGKVLWAIGYITAGLTAFYMSRLFFMTFFGESRVDAHTKEHLHESPMVMVIPLAILAVLSLIGGFIGWPAALGGSNPFHHWLSSVFNAGVIEHHTASHAHPIDEYVLMALSVSLAIGAAIMAYKWYAKKSDQPAAFVAKFSGLHRLIFNKYFIDELYQATFVRGLLAWNRFLAWFDGWFIDGIVNGVAQLGVVVSRINGWIDKWFVDGLVNLVANFSRFMGSLLRRVQTGQIQSYVYFAMFGLTLAVILRYIF